MQDKQLEVGKGDDAYSQYYEQRNALLLADLRKKRDALVHAIEERLPIPQDAKEKEITEILEKRNQIMAILDQKFIALVDPPHKSVNEYKQKLQQLEILHKGLQPSNKLGKIADKLEGTPREKIKSLLGYGFIGKFIKKIHKGSSEPSFRELDVFITDYVNAQTELVAHKIAYQDACKQADAMKKMQKKYPRAQIDQLVLKRHEHCSNLNKGFGFKRNTGLDAFSVLHSANQSQFELQNVQSVQTQRVLYLKEMGVIGHVKAIVSTVQRAHETFEYAALRQEVVDETEFNGAFVEKSEGLSGRAKESASALKTQFQAKLPPEKQTTVRFKNDTLITNEKPEAFQQRLKTCKENLFSDFTKEEQSKGSLLFVAGHGKMSREILKFLVDDAKKNGLPFEFPDTTGMTHKEIDKLITLYFGSQHNILVARNPDNGEVIGYEFIGITSNLGQTKEKALADYLSELQTKIDKQEDLVPSLFKYCILQEDETMLGVMLQKYGSIMLDNLDLLPIDSDNENLDQAKVLVNALYEYACCSAIAEKNVNQPASKFGLFQRTAQASAENPFDRDLALLQELKTSKDTGFEGFADKHALQQVLDKTSSKKINQVSGLVQAINSIRENETPRIALSRESMSEARASVAKSEEPAEFEDLAKPEEQDSGPNCLI